ncbi:MAG: hypothetical protein CSB44_03055 [Gammaproteobacteria bacterium]|nr:MAG: hypothetical protein CSB44_03055 [Gammaproteobacteria bacterium]
MGDTLLALLCAHLLADFLLQTRTMIRRKHELSMLLLHVLIVTGLSALLLGSSNPVVLLAIFASHFLFDWLKIRFCDNSALPFILDQLAHLSVIVLIAITLPTTFAEGAWPTWLPPPLLDGYLLALSLVAGTVATVVAGGFLIEKLTAPLAREIMTSAPTSGDKAVAGTPDDGRSVPTDNPLPDGLTHGGKVIGWLERLLVLVLILADMANGIGFLVVAKSIMRFGDIRDSGHRKLAEYIIIGTFASFCWALLVALPTRAAMLHYLP